MCPLQEHQEPKRRRDAGILQVTQRDEAALTWISEQFCISFDHLRYLLGREAKAATKTPGILSISATRDTVERWLQLGFIEQPHKIIAGYPPYLWLSRRGLSQLALPYAYYKPQISTARHIYAVNALRLHLESLPSPLIWYPERAIMRKTTSRPIPDAELHTTNAHTIAVKVIEVSFQSGIIPAGTLDTLNALTMRYKFIWCFLHTQALIPLQQALTTLDQQVQQRITIYELDPQAIATSKQREGKTIPLEMQQVQAEQSDKPTNI